LLLLLFNNLAPERETMIPSEELADAIHQELLGTPYDPASTTPERHLIDFLEEQVENWEQGANSTENLLQTFDQNDVGQFDIRAWIQGWVDQGVYQWPPEQTPQE
jgi:hypothetical protein